MHLQKMTACQEDSFLYLTLTRTFILQTGFSEAQAVLFLMDKKKNKGGWETLSCRHCRGDRDNISFE